MGSGQNKDGFIDMFAQTAQQVYLPGTYVDGIVHINCKDNRNYSLLQLRFKGVEHVAWSQGSGKHRRHYSNTKVTYNSCFQLAVFRERVFPAGHYSFPFKFLLPSQITGSLFESQSTYIRYQLIAELIPSDDKNDLQTFVKNLNILQPCKQVLGAIQREQICNPQCCCCKSYGVVKVTMGCDKNFVQSGDKISVTGVVDNSAGTQEINNCEISFQDLRWKISSEGASRLHTLETRPLFMLPEPVLPGQKKQFSFSAMIPQGMNYSTAIGSVVSRFHVLNFSSHIGCCSAGANCQFLLVFNSKSQLLEVDAQVPPPPGWRPKVANQVVYTNFPPFHYQPTPGIPYINRAGMTNVANLQMMNNEMGNYPNQNNYNSIEANTMEQMPKLY